MVPQENPFLQYNDFRNSLVPRKSVYRKKTAKSEEVIEEEAKEEEQDVFFVYEIHKEKFTFFKAKNNWVKHNL